jgi:hypothetical protein
MTAVRCPKCDCFINSFQLKNDNCWSCGNDISILKPNTENDETNNNVIDEVEEKTNDSTKSLSQKPPKYVINTTGLSYKYSVLLKYKMFVYILMVIDTIFSCIFLMNNNNGDNMIIYTIIIYSISMFSLYCVIKIIEFLFDLDKKTDNNV